MNAKILSFTAALFLVGCGGGGGGDNVAVTNKSSVEGESYPVYYEKAERVALKDVMARYFGVNKKGILSYGLDDAAKIEGHVCPIVTGGYLISREGIKALKNDYEKFPEKSVTSSYDYADKMLYRGGIKVTLGGKEGLGNATNAMAKVISMITGAESASGFKHGPDYPFANRQNLLLQDPKIPFSPKEGIEVIFTSMKSTYTKADKDGKDTNQPIPYEQCEGLWGDCIEHTTCDRSVKITYKFATPEIMGAAPKNPWPATIKYIVDNYEKAINVQKVANPASMCK